MLYYLGAITAGALAGLLFALIWRRLVPMRVHGEFWTEMAALTKNIISVDDTAVFLRLYKQLALTAGSYMVRNLSGMVLSCAPLIIIVLTVGMHLFNGWDAQGERRGEQVAVIPAGAAILEEPGPSGTRRVKLSGNHENIVLDGPVTRTGICWSTLRCATLKLLGFQVIRLQPPVDEDVQPFIVRTDHDNWNPLWPYLGSLEFVFYLAVVIVVSTTLLWRIPSQ